MLFVILTFGFTLAALFSQNDDYFIGAAIFYVAQLIETACSNTHSYIRNVEPISNTEVMINKLKQTAP